MTSPRVQSYLIVVACIGLFGVVAVGRAVHEARSELRTAREQEGAGAPLWAVEHYRRALRWSFPLSPYEGDAVAGLERIAAELERAGDVDGALLAWRSLAGGLGATRTLYSDADPSRELAKDEIARLLGRHGAQPTDANLTTEQLTADHRRLFAREPVADPFWGTMLLVGFSVWVVSLVAMTRRGFDSKGQPRWREARWPASVALAGLVSFILGLLFA